MVRRVTNARSCCRDTSTGALTDAEMLQAESHLDGCDYCRRRYKFESELRMYVRLSAVERMPPGLMEKLAQLRSS